MSARTILAGLVGLLISFSLDAQEGQRGIATVDTEEEPLRVEPATRDFDRTSVLPELPPSRTPDRLANAPTVFVRDIHIEGGSVLSAEQVSALTSPYLGRLVSIEELNELRTQLSLAYFERGYVNSGVVLPDQRIDQGEVAFVEVMGGLNEIRFQGGERLSERWWSPRLASLQTDRLDINLLQEQLRLFEQEALVQRVEAKLLPGAEPGQGILELQATETNPWRVVFGVDNQRSPSLGGEQATVSVAHLSLTGHGDRAEVWANGSDGLVNWGAAYTVPVGVRGSVFRIYGSTGDAQIVERPFQLVDIRTDTTAYGMVTEVPILRTSSGGLGGFIGLEAQHSENTLLGMPWSFSLGEREGEADTMTVYGGLEWTRRAIDSATALRLTVRQGTDWFGTDIDHQAPNGLNPPSVDYLLFRGQAQYIRRLSWRDSTWHLRAAFQLAQTPLLPVEKMPVGGFDSVRGYRENLLVRDNGIVASAEWRMPLFPDRRVVERFDWRALTVALFADWGQSWDENTGLPSDRKERIYSVGAGALWLPWPGLQATVYYGEALNDLEAVGDDLQDRGWHFRVSYSLF